MITAVIMRNRVLHNRAKAVYRNTTGLLGEGVACDASQGAGCCCTGVRTRRVRRRKYTEAIREVGQDLKRRKDELAVSGGVLDSAAQEEDVQELFRFLRRRNGSGSQMDHLCAIQCSQGHGESVQRR